jgi:hypothetical protein
MAWFGSSISERFNSNTSSNFVDVHYKYFYRNYWAAEKRAKESSVQVIEIKLDDEVITATLDDSPTVALFVAQLPLRLELKDYAMRKKIGFLPAKLNTKNAMSGSSPLRGDVSYYAPWGNVAIFYQNSAYSPLLVRLGRVTQGIEQLNFSGAKIAVITLI